MSAASFGDELLGGVKEETLKDVPDSHLYTSESVADLDRLAASITSRGTVHF